MQVAQYVIVLVVIAVSVWLITGPLRAAHARSDVGDELADLEAARDAKYQEIRDAELDLRTGKLSDDDYQAIDQTLRTEAVEILRRLDELAGRERRGASSAGGGRPREDPPSLPSAP